MPGKTHADIPLSYFEYRAIYKRPLFSAQKLYWEITGEVFEAFNGWNVSLENVSYKQNPANFSEIVATFSLFGGRVAFNIGLGSIVMVVKDPNWSEAELIMAVGRAGLSAVLSSGGLSVEKQRASVAMHVKPASGSAKDFVSSILKTAASEPFGRQIRAYGISIYGEDSNWVVDASAAYNDALFIRIDQVADAGVTLEDIAARLKEDEMKVLELLQLEVD